MIMGQAHTSLNRRRHSSLKSSLGRPFSKFKNRNLSATFHVLDSDLKWDLLNVNTATEEELMTLPGITRTIARNIVDYRQAIGGFKKVEDLALVSGVGASKLEVFRSEVCVKNRKAAGSFTSSCNQSLESLQNSETLSRVTRISPGKVVNINTATVFQLMTVRGINQELAANIVHYRDKKGSFKCIEDLLKVKGMTRPRYTSLRTYLTVENDFFSESAASTPELTFSHRRTLQTPRSCSAPVQLNEKAQRGNDDLNREIYKLLTSLSVRPLIAMPMANGTDVKPVMRLASWNLSGLSKDKAANLGVKEVICRTALENRINLIACQEVTSKDALELIVSEFNEPELQNIVSWDPPDRNWNQYTSCSNSEMSTSLSGFLYSSSIGLKLVDCYTVHLGDTATNGLSVPPPCVGKFKIAGLEFIVVSIILRSLKPSDVRTLFPHFVEVLKRKLSGENNIFLVGDFSLPPTDTALSPLTELGFSLVWPPKVSISTYTEQDHVQIWCTENLKNMYTGHQGVIEEGLNHPMIPDGWSWGGTVSSYKPVWIECRLSPDLHLANGICKVTPIIEETQIELASAVGSRKCSRAIVNGITPDQENNGEVVPVLPETRPNGSL